MSGHIFFGHRWFGFDDGIYSSARLLELVSRTDRPVSTLLDDVPPTHSTPELRVDCPDDRKFAIVAKVVESLRSQYDVVDIDGVRVNFADGWGLVRASNTQPVLVMRAEALSPERRDAIVVMLEEEIRQASAAV
jgi:phosphomannomutase/phosphoglucomutase